MASIFFGWKYTWYRLGTVRELRLRILKGRGSLVSLNFTNTNNQYDPPTQKRWPGQRNTMPVGFGFSVGDFVAVIGLVHTVIDAVRDSSHVTSSFRALLTELYDLESALLRVKSLDADINQVQQVTLRHAASQCQSTIDAFYK